MATNTSASPPFTVTLRELPLPVRLTLSLFLIGVGLGYFAALMQLHFKNASKGQPLPTPNDVVEIFSGIDNWPVQQPAPPPPVSKLERLIMGPEDTALEPGCTSMGKAFFKGDRDYKKKVEQDPASEPRLHEQREGERLAVQFWIHLPDDQRKAAYENDDLPLPDALSNHPMTHTDANMHVRIQTLIQDRCGKCHDDAGKLGKKKLVDIEDFADVLVVPPPGHTSRQMTVDSLTQTTHLHLLSFCMLWMLTGVIFAFSSWPKWLRCIVAPLVLLAQVADVSCWWLARLTDPWLSLPHGVGPYFALAIIGTGAVVGVGLFLQIVLSLWDMYHRPGRLALLVLLIGAVVAAALVVPHVQKYLNDEAAPAANAPAAQK